MMNINLRLYTFLWVLYFLQSMMFMYTWLIPGGIIGLIILMMSSLNICHIHYERQQFSYVILLVGLVAFFKSYDIENVLYAINILALPFCIFYLVQTPQWYKKHLVNKIRDVFYYLLLPSLPLFILHQIGLPFISVGATVHGIYEGVNHIFYFCQPYYGIRFNSYFCEPGHLGMVLAFLLYSQGYDFRNRRNLYLLICLFFTLSLAAYVLTAIGFLFFRVNSGKLSIRTILSLFFIFLLSLLIAYNIPTVRELILERLIFDSDSGSFSGDNRINWNAEQFMLNISLEEFMYGIGTKMMDAENIAGTGFFIHCIRYGFLSVILIFIYYVLLFIQKPRNILNYGILLLYIFSFYQRSYALWACELILFVTFIDYSDIYGKKNKLYCNNTK